MKFVGLKCCVLGGSLALVAGCPGVVTTTDDGVVETNKEACVSANIRVVDCFFIVSGGPFPPDQDTQELFDGFREEQIDSIESRLCADVPETATEDCNWHTVAECFASHSCTEIVSEAGICEDDVVGCPPTPFEIVGPT